MIRSSATHRQHSLKKNLVVDTSLSGSSHPRNHQTVLEKKHVIILSMVIMMIAYVTLVSVLSTSSLLVEAGHAKVKVWRGPTKGDHKHRTASFGYWFHHDGQLEGGHGHHHHHSPLQKGRRNHHQTHHHSPPKDDGQFRHGPHHHTAASTNQANVLPSPLSFSPIRNLPQGHHHP